MLFACRAASSSPAGGDRARTKPDTLEETQRLYDALSEGSSENAPPAEMFWRATWGGRLDRYRRRWMSNFAPIARLLGEEGVVRQPYFGSYLPSRAGLASLRCIEGRDGPQQASRCPFHEVDPPSSGSG